MIEALMVLLVLGGLVLCVGIDQHNRTRRRELEHLERLKALELGRPLEDAETARAESLGAIGVSAAVSSLAAAVLTTCFVLYLLEADLRLTAILLLLIWLVCGLVGGGIAGLCVYSLGMRRPPSAGHVGETPGGSGQITTQPREFGS